MKTLTKAALLGGVVVLLGCLSLLGMQERDKRGEEVLKGVYAAYGGYTTYEGQDLPEGIKEQLREYQGTHLAPDDTTLVLLKDVRKFEEESVKIDAGKRVEEYYNNLPPGGEKTKGVTPKVGLQEIDKEALEKYDAESKQEEDPRVIERENMYEIKINDLDLGDAKIDMINHKGLSMEVSREDIPRETYKLRQSNANYKYYTVKRSVHLREIVYVCAAFSDKKIIEVDVKFRGITPKAMKVCS